MLQLTAPAPIQPGSVLRPSAFSVWAAPFGVWSLALWGVLILGIFVVPVIGWVNKRELMQQQVAAWSPSVWAAVVGIPLSIIAMLLLSSACLSRRRIEVQADRVVVRGVLRDTEVPIQGVVKVVRHVDGHAFSSSLRLHYHADTRVRTLSGWLFGEKPIEGLAAYIVQRNSVFKPTMETHVHV